VIEHGDYKNIAKNKALKENLFMMVVCIENRIPLYVVGKPGSSKSLSKSMVTEAMKGANSPSDLFRTMKEVLGINLIQHTRDIYILHFVNLNI
jgi:hypothetical protein